MTTEYVYPSKTRKNENFNENLKSSENMTAKCITKLEDQWKRWSSFKLKSSENMTANCITKVEDQWKLWSSLILSPFGKPHNTIE